MSLVILHRRRLTQAVKDISFSTTSETNSLIDNTYSGVKRGVDVSNSGHRMYVTLRTPTERVSQWGMTTPGDISTLTELTGILEGQLSDPRAIRISPDGTKFYYGRSGIREFDLTTPFDISTAVDTGRYLTTKYTISGFDISHDGTKVYVTDLGNHVVEYTLDTPWQITPASLNPTEIFVYTEDSTTGELTATNGICDELNFFNDGKIMMVTDRLTTYGAFNIYKTDTPYVIESYVLDKRLKDIGWVLNSSVATLGNARDVKKVFTHVNSVGYQLT